MLCGIHAAKLEETLRKRETASATAEYKLILALIN